MTKMRNWIKVTTILVISLSIVMPSFSTKDTAVGQSPFSLNADSSNLGPKIGKESIYVDGIHTATGNYGSYDSSISVTITLVDDVIIGIQIIPHATDRICLDLEQRFADVIPSVVVGKHIDEIEVDRLAGYNLVTDGLESAIDQIKEQNRIGPTMRWK